MNLEIQTNKDNQIEYIKYNGKKIGTGLLKMMITLKEGQMDIGVIMSERTEQLVDDDFFNNKNITFYIEKEEKKCCDKESLKQIFGNEGE